MTFGPITSCDVVARPSVRRARPILAAIIGKLHFELAHGDAGGDNGDALGPILVATVHSTPG